VFLDISSFQNLRSFNISQL